MMSTVRENLSLTSLRKERDMSSTDKAAAIFDEEECPGAMGGENLLDNKTNLRKLEMLLQKELKKWCHSPTLTSQGDCV